MVGSLQPYMVKREGEKQKTKAGETDDLPVREKALGKENQSCKIRFPRDIVHTADHMLMKNGTDVNRIS